jgi:AraC family transcriptional regulator
MVSAVRLELDRVLPHRLRGRRWSFAGERAAFAPTAHAGVELAWVEQGAIRYRLGSRQIEIGPGQVMLVPAGVDHASEFIGAMRGGSVHLDDGLVARAADAMGRRSPVEPGLLGEGAEVTTLGRLLVGELARDSADARLCADRLAEALALKALGAMDAPSAARGAPDARVKAAVELIHARFQEPLEIDQVAASCNTNRFQLSRLFKAATGKSPYQYLIDVRLEDAARSLREGRAVTDAALSAGFSDLSRFARMFQRRYGILPSGYRRS